MSGAPDAPIPPTDAAPTVAAATRRLISEDWAATIVGLLLLLMVLAGIITHQMIP